MKWVFFDTGITAVSIPRIDLVHNISNFLHSSSFSDISNLMSLSSYRRCSTGFGLGVDNPCSDVGPQRSSDFTDALMSLRRIYLLNRISHFGVTSWPDSSREVSWLKGLRNVWCRLSAEVSMMESLTLWVVSSFSSKLRGVLLRYEIIFQDWSWNSSIKKIFRCVSPLIYVRIIELCFVSSLRFRFQIWWGSEWGVVGGCLIYCWWSFPVLGNFGMA